jgi:hypothetical protein
MTVVRKTSKTTPWGGSPSGQGTRYQNIHTPAQTAVATVISGPGRERLADPQIEFVLSQPPLDERRLEHLDHLLAAGGCHLISRPCHRGASPPA